MLKCFAICATLLILGFGSVRAQQQDVVVRKTEVPGTNLEMVVVMSKAQADITSGLADQEHPRVASPTGDWLAFATDCEIERLFGRSRSLIQGLRVERKEQNLRLRSTSISFPGMPGPSRIKTSNVIARRPYFDKP